MTIQGKRPKYVFFFIGDGMGPVQYQLTSNYLYRMSDPEVVYLRPQKMLNFMHFPTVGTVMTPDSTSFVPDSASTATAMSTGEKTHTMAINTDEVGDIFYRPLPENLRDAGYQLAVVTTAFINDATPAAFYSRHHDRYERYPIAAQMGQVGVSIFAGGDIVEPDDPEGEGENAFDLLRQNGYTIVKTRAEAEALTADDLPVYILAEDMDPFHSVPFAIDRKPEAWDLAKYVEKSLDLLGEDNFFMLCEGAKIDWACHNNSTGTMLHETIDFTKAIDVALAFAEEHPDDTLILVTADHETGGLSQGFTTTHYMTYLENFQHQRVSYDVFRHTYVKSFVEQQVPFEEAMVTVGDLFGLQPPVKDQLPNPGSLVLSEGEWGELEKSYELTLDKTFTERRPTEREFLDYAGYNPFVVTINRIFNRKSGVEFSTFGHTATPVTIFGKGIGSENFTGLFDNTEIYFRLRELLTGQAVEEDNVFYTKEVWEDKQDSEGA